MDGLRVDIEIDARDAHGAVQRGVPLIDVREPEELAVSRISAARSMPLGAGLDMLLDELAALPEAGIVVCASGVRSRAVVEHLHGRGARGWRNLTGGIVAWSGAGLPVDSGGMLTADQAYRYERQVRLPEVGVEGQARLLAARVLVVGAGGLGCPAIAYLAGAGVGTLGLVDHDEVDVSNLHRQTLFGMQSVGMLKVEEAARRARDANPDVDVHVWPQRFDAGSGAAVLDEGWDVVVDCTDSISARYELGDACVARGIPLVHGSIYRSEGRVAVLGARGRPCWRCVYPTAPTGALVPSCADAGVLGVLPGIIGTMQAAEVLKLLLGAEGPLLGRLLVYDLRGPSMDVVTLAPRPGCPTCGLDDAS